MEAGMWKKVKGKEGRHAAIAGVFTWLFAGLLLEDILLGACCAAAAFLLAFAAMAYIPVHRKRMHAKKVEAQLPFLLMNIAIELNLGVDFLKCLENAAKQGGAAGREMHRVVEEARERGAAVQEALLHFAERTGSRMVNRAVSQMVAVFEQGNSKGGGEAIKRIAGEILTRQKTESKLFSGRLVVFSLLFIAVSAIVPALFQSFAIVGSVVLKMHFTAPQIFLVIVLLFPLLDLAVLFYIKSKTPVFMRE